MGVDGLTAGAVARRLGVAVTTLRTWHQRYGLGPSEHVPGHHRRYTAEDLDRLEVMRRLTAQGVAPAEAAAWARRTPLDGAPPGAARHGGGNAIPLGAVGAAARGLGRAAMRLDAPAMRDILEMVIEERGVIGAWTDVIMPVLVGVGERYEATQRFVEVEHLLSRAVTEALGSVPRPGSLRSPQVLLAAADEEQHTLPLEALAAALAEAGIPARLYGARVPPTALADAIERTGPTVVVLWSQTPVSSDPAQLEQVAAGPHAPLLVAAAGPGWAEPLPPGVVQLTDLTTAVETVTAAVT
ncbi:MerR family transcriptional regulator [Paractinoplanes brasiliensis]|uniref:B12 binding protein n=1 Tax=Paractinoplanes brasiliensis TaxID=52695 RepID=A0A4R6JRN3_9ACTN|nr:MerR family transcriptional regulator [Actinoplanes brasiliensis]TDO39313.1 B12 binding protein [Actinoplanes brasiliensis]GID32667.1 transcriptional regulator [Actinoplanes brasiliensis]